MVPVLYRDDSRTLTDGIKASPTIDPVIQWKRKPLVVVKGLNFIGRVRNRKVRKRNEKGIIISAKLPAREV